jgi:hypothetical protein
MPEVLRLIQDARAQGIDVAASVYPYTRASNGLAGFGRVIELAVHMRD